MYNKWLIWVLKTRNQKQKCEVYMTERNYVAEYIEELALRLVTWALIVFAIYLACLS